MYAIRISFVVSALVCACSGTTDNGNDGVSGGGGAQGGASHGGSTSRGAAGSASGGTSHGAAGSASGGTAGGTQQGGRSAGGATTAGEGGDAFGGEGGAGGAGDDGKAGSGGSGTAGSGGAAGTCDATKMCCPTSKCACPYPAGNGIAGAISDFEDGKTKFKPTNVDTASGYWDFSRDSSAGTTMPASNATLLPVDGGANGTAKALHVTGSNLTGWGGALAAILSNGCPFDASKYGGFSFYAKGTSSTSDGNNKLLVLVGNPEYIPKTLGGFCDDNALDARCFARHRVLIELKSEWKQFIIPWDDLKAATFGSPLPFGPNRVRDIIFSANGPSKPTDPAASFDFWIDQLAFTPIVSK